MEVQPKIESKIFISHSHKDKNIALDLKKALKERAIDAWAFELDLPFGRNIVNDVKACLTKADCVLFLLSEHSRQSQWVGKELGLALDLQEKGSGRPQIIGVLCESASGPFNFDVLNYESGQVTGRRYDFTEGRCFNVDGTGLVDSLETLTEQFIPKVTFITLDSDEEEYLMEQSRECYEELFPDDGERDEFDYIITWLRESRKAVVNYDPWREIYAVLHIQDYVMGMAYLTASLQGHWAFGNYFGVRKGWRQYRRAEIFIEDVMQKMQDLFPQLKGVLFEVDPIDLILLSNVAENPQRIGQECKGKILSSLRALRRLCFYQEYMALPVIQPDGQPLKYCQPAMKELLTAENERELILMMRSLQGTRCQEIREEEIKDMLHFIYDALYSDAYGGAGDIEIEGYRSYVAEVKARIEARVVPGCRVGKIIVPSKFRSLLNRAKKDCPEELAL